VTTEATPRSAIAPSSGDVHAFIQKIYADGFALGEDNQPHEIKWSLAPARGEFVYEMCRKSGAHATLEVGFALGVSTLCILAALLDLGVTGTSHVAMDPFQGGERFANAGLRTLRDGGVASMVEFHAEASETFLPRLVAAKRQFDFILIDGDHSFDHTLIDIFFAHRLLRPGGTLVIDDIDMPPVYLANRYLLDYYRYELIDEAYGSHSDATQTWQGAAISTNGRPPETGPRVWIRAYRKPLSEPEDQSFWGAPLNDFMRFWIDDFHDPKLMSDFQRRALNVEAMRNLNDGQMRTARRYLIASLARDPLALRTYLRLARTFLPRPLATLLGARANRKTTSHNN
jgi:predicted O-methyltransferase YrrM